MLHRFLFMAFLVPVQVPGLAENSHVVDANAVKHIDRLVQDKWDSQEITPAPRSGDAEFCRRLWLDLAGVVPPITHLRTFLESDDANKRPQLIDQLLQSPQHANHMANRWNEILLPPDVLTQAQQRDNVTALHDWLRTQFRENTAYDYLVREFLTAGGAGNAGPAIFYTSHTLEPEKLAAATSRIFMGLQLQCAQCHDHPFDRWTQEDFWQYAAFFSQLSQRDSQTGRDAIIEDRPGGEVTLPETDIVMPPRYPGIVEPPEVDPADMRRRQLTIWMASRDNPYFARAAVNRAWAHLFGRGLVDPVDAMDADNPPSHPELLDYLASYFVRQRFNLRSLYATLARTEAYGRTSRIIGAKRPPETSFAAMSVKTLSGEQFYDSMLQNVPRKSPLPRDNVRSADRATRGQFLARMLSPGSSPRDYPHGVVQVLGLMNGPEITNAVDPNRTGLLASLEAPFFSDADRIETLFLATLSRPPRPEEAQRFTDHLARGNTPQDKKAALSDLLWILFNTAEFAVCP